jgi:hypothetical protein
VTLKRALDLAQALNAGELAIGERYELCPHRKGPNPPVPALLFHKRIEAAPRYMLQQAVKHAIFMPHGIAPLRVQIVAKRPDRSRINVMRHVHKIKLDSRGLDPAIH